MGRWPLSLAAFNGSLPSVLCLIRCSGPEALAQALFLAVSKDHLPCMVALSQAGADCSSVDRDGRTLLMSAAMYGSEKCLEELLRSGAEVDATDPVRPL